MTTSIDVISNIKQVFPYIMTSDITDAINTVRFVESRITGRVCGNYGDKIAQYLTIINYHRATRSNTFDALEIGTLFGGSCLIKLIAMQNIGINGKITCIDPMTGYYGKELDPISGIPVNAQSFWHNIKTCGFSFDDVELLEFKSCDPHVLQRMKDKQYAIIMIDGDHSLQGVYFDWIHYSCLALPYGLVIIDDFAESSWPDITYFTGTYLGINIPSTWHNCGILGSTYVVQKTNGISLGHQTINPESNDYPELPSEIIHDLDKSTLRKKLNNTYAALNIPSDTYNLYNIAFKNSVDLVNNAENKKCGMTSDTLSNNIIDLLSPELLESHAEIVNLIYKTSSQLDIGLGWHYALDLTWIVSRVLAYPKGSIILDAGAGNGLLQFVLADLGYRVISVDFSNRDVPNICKLKYNITHYNNGTSFDNEYIQHLDHEFNLNKHITDNCIISGNIVNNLTKSSYGTITYYNSDICNMSLIDDNSIDCIVSISALEHNSHDHVTRAIQELKRVLKLEHNMFITVNASNGDDWYHEQSKGWCYSEPTIKDIFGISSAESNFPKYNQILSQITECKFLENRLDRAYFRSVNNGMPLGIWNPQYVPVGIAIYNNNPTLLATENVVNAQKTPHTTAYNVGTANFAVLIDTTDGCNLRCSFCSRNNKNITIMSTADFATIMQKVAPYAASLQLCCAWEYSIAPNAQEIVATLGKYGINNTTIYTNGQILPESLAQTIIDANIGTLVFSVGEAYKETYERLRKGGNFERLLKNIRGIADLKERLKVKHPKLCANLTVTRSNISELPEFVNLAYHLGISEIRGRHLILNQGLEMDNEVIDDYEYANAILEQTQKKADWCKISFNVPRYQHNLPPKNCNAPLQQLYISSNGDTSVCPRIHTYEVIGNLINQDLNDVLNSHTAKRLRQQMTERVFTNPVCGICLQNKETSEYIDQGF